MAETQHPDRRTVLIAAAAIVTAGAAPALAQAGRSLGEDSVAVFEADQPAARAFARSLPARLAIDGDRVRFARRLFHDERPLKVVGMTRYADFLLLAESAREEGYRTTLAGPAPLEGTALFVWTSERT